MASRAQEGWKGNGILKDPGIPTPSGQYRVGCVDLVHHLQGDEKGGLLVRLHYPTEATPGAEFPYASWYPHSMYIRGTMEAAKIPVREEDIAKIINPQYPALEGTPLLSYSGTTAPPTFPVIVFSHGLTGWRTASSGIVCDLVSHGYVVGCVEHRDESACVTLQRVPKPGGRDGELEDYWLKYYHIAEGEQEFPVRNKQVKQRADDAMKTLDLLTLLNEGGEINNMLEGSYDFKQFKGRMDIGTVAIMGHSYGGGTTVQTLAQDPRFKCGIGMDTWMFPLHEDLYKHGISQPLYFINSHNFQWVVNVQQMMSLTKEPDADGITPCRVLTIDGTHHLNQCDVPFVAPLFLKHLNLEESRLDNMTAHHVNLDICKAFFKRHLLKDPALQGVVPDLDGSEGHCEHIIFGTNLVLNDSNSHL